MFLKNILPAILILYITNCFGQVHTQKSNRLTSDVTEKFYVLKDNPNVRDSLYQAFYRKRTVIVRGNYTQGKKTGRWAFYNPRGLLLQVYDYDRSTLKYEAREDTTSYMRYLVDKELSDSDKVTKPVKIGGRYYGYLPYVGLYKTPLDIDAMSASSFVVVVELLVSPLGRLADYKVHVVSDMLNYDQTTTMDVNLFSEEDKEFLPATLNGQPILSRILIRCRMIDGGGLDFFY